MNAYSDFDSAVKNLNGIEIKKDSNVGGLTRYGTGGNADYLIIPKTTDELILAVNELRGKIPYFVLGGGSNVLVSDDGFRGAVILTKKLTRTDVKGNLYFAECGVKLSNLIEDSTLNSLGGLEFAVGIPATVGGAVSMNAGCYSKSVADAVCYVVTEKGIIPKSECGFGYRTSRFINGETVVKVCFSLTPSEIDVIEDKIRAYRGYRKNPKGKSCGSVFKNEGYFAGKVIDECGLKGLRQGGAKISAEHANFIIADKGATSSDIYTLIRTVKQKVYEKKQITLCEELIYLGDFK